MAGSRRIPRLYRHGWASGLHKGKLRQTSRHLPVVIGILDSEKKVKAFLDVLDRLLMGGVVTAGRAGLLRFSRKPKASRPVCGPKAGVLEDTGSWYEAAFRKVPQRLLPQI